jgi:NADH-quinone oxidoreductase subunit B
MKWTITKPAEALKAESDSLDEAIQKSVVFSRLEDLISWGRKNSIWPFNFGLSWRWPLPSPAAMILPVSVVR